MERKKPWALHILLSISMASLLYSACSFHSISAELLQASKTFSSTSPSVVTKEERRVISHTESGTVAAADMLVGSQGGYHLQFITLDPGSLFLPVLLHADMLFYVHTGRGCVNWVDDDGKKSSLEVVKGDIYSLGQGSIFYIRSYPDPMREKLRLHAIFNTINGTGSIQIQEDFVDAYTKITDLVLGFDEKVLRIGFGVSEEVIQGIKMVKRPPSIIPFPKDSEDEYKEEDMFLEINKKKKKEKKKKEKKKKEKEKEKEEMAKAYNIFQRDPDVKNCNGWSTAVTGKDLEVLKESDLGVFMVNLTKGSMMGPHWNPQATEIGIGIHGRGVVEIVCPNNSTEKECRSSKIRVQEGDVFLVPRFHPMVQMAFNNDSFVFVGFSTRARNNHPQFLAGKRSVFQVIDKEVLAVAFNAPNASAIDILLQAQEDSIILECTSCAEEAEKKMEEEEREKREEEERREERERKEDEEAQKRQEEEEKKREEREREEEEEAKKKKEEERKEEARKRKEEDTKKEEKAARKSEEEMVRRQQEEEEEEQMEIWEHQKAE